MQQQYTVYKYICLQEKPNANNSGVEPKAPSTVGAGELPTFGLKTNPERNVVAPCARLVKQLRKARSTHKQWEAHGQGSKTKSSAIRQDPAHGQGSKTKSSATRQDPSGNVLSSQFSKHKETDGITNTVFRWWLVLFRITCNNYQLKTPPTHMQIQIKHRNLYRYVYLPATNGNDWAI